MIYSRSLWPILGLGVLVSSAEAQPPRRIIIPKGPPITVVPPIVVAPPSVAPPSVAPPIRIPRPQANEGQSAPNVVASPGGRPTGRFRDLSEIDPQAALKSIAAFEKLMANSPYDFKVGNSATMRPAALAPSWVDASIYSDSAGVLPSKISKMALKSSQVATHYVLQISEAGDSTFNVDDGGAWDKPHGLASYQAREITLSGAGDASATFLADFPIEASVLSAAAGTVDAAIGKTLYLRVVPVKPRTSFERPAPHIGMAPRLGTTAGGTMAPGAAAGEAGGSLLDRLRRRPARGNRPVALASAREKWQLVGAPTPWRLVYVAGNQADVAVLVAAKRKAALAADLVRLQLEVAARYKVEILSYIPPKLTDDSEFSVGGQLELTRDVSFKGRNWKKGQFYNPGVANGILNQKSGGKALASEFYSLLTGSINQVSEGWSAAKAFAVDTIAKGLNGSGILDCGATCRAAISTGLNIALTYCGIPPSIPNSRQLFEGGSDYLAGAAADALLEQATGVNPEIFDGVGGDHLKRAARTAVMTAATSGIDRLAAEMGCAAPGQADCGFKGDNAYTWGVPSPYFQKRSGVIWIKISREEEASDDEWPAYLGVDVQRKPGASASKSPEIFQPTGASKLFMVPDEGLVVPILLTPTTASQMSNVWRLEGYVSPNYIPGDPLTRSGQPYYQSISGKITIRTSHLVKSQYAQYPQCVTKEWVIDKNLPLEKPFDGIDGDNMNGYFGELPYNPAPL